MTSGRSKLSRSRLAGGAKAWNTMNNRTYTIEDDESSST